MKICHIADIHQGVGFSGPTPFSRFTDIERVLDWIADKIITEKVDLVLLCGDCFKDAKVMLDRASQEIASIVRFLRRLSDAKIGTLVISGTPSHDAVSAYELMGEMWTPYVNIFAKPSIFNEYNVACLPGLNRSALMTQEEYKGLPTEQVHRIMTDKITMLCQGLSAQMPNDKPKILMAHMTYQGADTGFTDLMMQHEPILTREAVAGFDLVCLGHIHRPQIINSKVFYSGPIERLSFNEEEITPGFWIHEVTDDLPYDRLISQFIETPARRYVTLDWDEEELGNCISYPEVFLSYLDIQDAIVRLNYSCSDEVNKQLNRKQLEQTLYDAGAFFVSEIKADIAKTDRARDSEVTESLTVEQALAKWCSQQKIDDTETAELVGMTSRLM
jgi:exonuclease SbcD